MDKLIVILRLIVGSIISVVLAIGYLAIFICIILPLIFFILVISSIACIGTIIKDLILPNFNKKNNTFDP